jgi:hypothetical protein
MIIFILGLIGSSIIFLSYFFSGVFYIIKKPQIIIDKKLSKTQKLYDITNTNAYLNNIGKLNIYISIIFLLGFITAIYMDKIKYRSPNYKSVIL